MSDAVAMSFKAKRETFERCGTAALLPRAPEIIDAIAVSAAQKEYWTRYQKEFPYAGDISFADALSAVRELLQGT